MATDPHEVVNAVIHFALRRDLERTRAVLATPVSDERRVAICDHLDWMLDYLHRHHVAEDEAMWPRVVAKRPSAHDLQEQMAAEHTTMAAAAEQLKAAVAAYRSAGTDDSRLALVSAVDRMCAATFPHLEHEERDAAPLISATLDHADWSYVEKNYFRKDSSLSEFGTVSGWWRDGLDADRAAVVKAQVPKPLVLFIDLRYGKRYDRAAALRWGALARART